MRIDDIAAIVRIWAEPKPLIQDVFLFGSRARGDFRSDSDLDLAISIDVGADLGDDQSGGWHIFMDEKDVWQDELSALFPFEPHLNCLMVDRPGPPTDAAVAREGVLLYQKPGMR